MKYWVTADKSRSLHGPYFNIEDTVIAAMSSARWYGESLIGWAEDGMDMPTEAPAMLRVKQGASFNSIKTAMIHHGAEDKEQNIPESSNKIEENEPGDQPSLF